jgi:hypothetical protein
MIVAGTPTEHKRANLRSLADPLIDAELGAGVCTKTSITPFLLLGPFLRVIFAF